MKAYQPIPPFAIYDYKDVGNEYEGSKYIKENEKEVLGFEFSINSTDFSNAQTNGVNLEKGIALQRCVYNKQTYALIEGEEFELYKTYNTGNYVELLYKRKSLN